MILVCYLVAPGENFFPPYAQAFAKSYFKHPAGIEHDCLLVLKDDAQPPAGIWRWPSVAHSNDGLDIGSLQQVARSHDHYDHILWLGSYARILADDWLAKFHAAVQLPGVGAAAATGSFEAGVSGRSPNPHLRTSSLMISPQLLNSLGFAAVHSRMDAYEFEHGLNSLYQRLRHQGLSGVVVGRGGKAYREHEWASSRTFRHGKQPELLIADNHTDGFARSSRDQKLAYARMAGWEPC